MKPHEEIKARWCSALLGAPFGSGDGEVIILMAYRADPDAVTWDVPTVTWEG